MSVSSSHGRQSSPGRTSRSSKPAYLPQGLWDLTARIASGERLGAKSASAGAALTQEVSRPFHERLIHSGCRGGIDGLGRDVPADQGHPAVFAGGAASQGAFIFVEAARMAVRTDALIRVEERQGREISRGHR